MKMKSSNMKFMLYITAVFSMLYMVTGTATAGTIVNSIHDFSKKGYTGGEICVTCHTPHKADISVLAAPLWNHQITQKVFTPYGSNTFDGTYDDVDGQPTGVSKLCLSCHDGTLGIDAFGKFPTNNDPVTGDKATGADDINNDHPISFAYDANLIGIDKGLHDPDTGNITIGLAGDKTKSGTITEVLLSGGMLQCSSCHDVHNNYVQGAPLLKITKIGSALCLTCHDK